MELVAGIARLRCRPVVADAATGNTIRNTVAGLRIETVRPQIDSEEPRAAIRSLIGRPTPDSRLGGKAAIFLATAEEGPARTIAVEAQASAIDPAQEEERIG